MHQQLTGDGEIVARVNSVENTHAEARAGVMMRESLTAGSTFVGTLAKPGNIIAYGRRASTGGSAGNTNKTGIALPRWVKVTRAGNVFTSYHSGNGTSWTQIGSVTIAMGSTIYVGLAVSSNADGTLCTGVFDNVIFP